MTFSAAPGNTAPARGDKSLTPAQSPFDFKPGIAESRRVFRKLGHILLVLALVLTLGLHWALLQTIAWTGMVISYSRDNPFREAVSMTFDGQHPCALCHVVKEGRAATQEQEESLPVNKLPLADIWAKPHYCFDSDRESILIHIDAPDSRVEAPPKPRPRIPSPTGAA